MMKFKLAILISVLVPQLAGAESLKSELRLRKLSLHLRGRLPDRSEYDVLKTTLGTEREKKFFDETTQAYLKTPQHVNKMYERLQALFRMNRYITDVEDRALNPTDSNDYRDSMTTLFKSLASDNLNWHLLLTARSYLIDPTAADSRYSSGRGFPSDVGFFNGAAKGLPASTDGYVRKVVPDPYYNIDSNPNAGNSYVQRPPLKVEFEADDPRVAGAVTTSHFMARYSTTNLNRNRGRAAAVFRIFLCDEMKPVVLPSSNQEKALLENALKDANTPDTAPRAGTMAHSAMTRMKHAADPMCASCHYKLDPMGKTFDSIDNVLGPNATPGALVFKRADGTLVNIPARGIGDIARALVKQPEYARCQVQHFWRWFIGKDLPLSESRLNELTRKFSALDERTNDFVAYLVNEPEFYNGSNKTQGNLGVVRQAKAAFTTCNQCHAAGMQAQPIPSFTTFPIGGNVEAQKQWLGKIAEKMDLANNGANAQMPPKAAGLSTPEQTVLIQAVKNWICSGAPDESGAATLRGNEVPRSVCAK